MRIERVYLLRAKQFQNLLKPFIDIGLFTMNCVRAVDLHNIRSLKKKYIY